MIGDDLATEFCTCTGSIPATLVSSRKKGVTASCKTCRGRPLVDSIGSFSGSMMSTLGIELTNFINPDLIWKTAVKGNRTATRRTRKRIAGKATGGVEATNKSSREVEGMAVSESEKLGVAILGQHFKGKVEHVPIKKRRFIDRSPSPPPPQTPSPLLEVPGEFVHIQDASGQCASWNSNGRQGPMRTDTSTVTKFRSGVVHGKTSEVTIEKLDCIGDFSGIEILAAVACNSGVGDDINHVEGNPLIEEPILMEPSSSASAMHVEEATASLETASVSPNDMVYEDETENSVFQDNPVAVSHESPADENNRKVEKFASTRDDRSHWDLNLSMDAWEQPCDFGHDDSQMVVQEDVSVSRSEKLQVLQDYEIQREARDYNHDDTTEGVVPSDINGNIYMPSDLRDLPVRSDGSDRKEDKLGGCSDVSRNHDECVLTTTDNYQESLISNVADAKVLTQVVSIDACLDSSAYPDNIASTGLSEEIRSTPSNSCNVNQSTEDGASDMELGKMLCVENVQVEDSDLASPYVPVLEKVTCEIDSTILNEDGGLHLEKSSAQEMVSVDSYQHVANVSLRVEPVSLVEEVGIDHSSPKCGDTSASTGDDKSVVTMDAKGQADGASSVPIAEIDCAAQVGAEELTHNSSGNSSISQGVGGSTSHEVCRIYDNDPTSSLDLPLITIEDPSDDSCGSDVSQDDKDNFIGQNSMELQAGYDSQFEDGELRESDLCWEENEGEGGEIEHVDYEFESEEERLCHFAESSENKMEVVNGPSSEFDFVVENIGVTEEPLRGNSVSLRTGISEMSGGSKINKHAVVCMDGSDAKDCSSSVVGFKASKRELLSRVEGSLSSGAIKRGRSDIFDDSYPRDESDAGSDKFMERDRPPFHVRARSPGGGHFVNPSTGYWDSKRHHLPIYNGPYSGRPRPKRLIKGRRYVLGSDHTVPGAAAATGLDNHIRRQLLNSSSNGGYRSLIRRKAPADRDDTYGIHTGILSVRDTSPDRSRFRRYQQGVSRGFRDIHRPMPDNSTDYSGRMPQRLARRERSISPLGGGRPHYSQPYKKSRSRSRSRSPVAWHRTRSPNFRPDARMERVRLPFQKRFAADSEEGFMSLPRNRFSPQRNSRWFEERNYAVDNFRGFMSPPRNRFSQQRNSRWFEERNSGLDNFKGRKSPGRMFRQNPRFDSVRSIQRVNSDDYCRPLIRPRRFPDVAAGGRGCKYEGSDEDKHENKNEMIRRVRRYDTDGVARQFRYDAEDSFVVNDCR